MFSYLTFSAFEKQKDASREEIVTTLTAFWNVKFEPDPMDLKKMRPIKEHVKYTTRGKPSLVKSRAKSGFCSTSGAKMYVLVFYRRICLCF
jgi:hypothetical protein